MPKKKIPTDKALYTFPQRLRLARRERKWTADKLAGQSGVDSTSISRYEHEERIDGIQANTVLVLARALRVRPGWLLSGEEPMDDPKAAPTIELEPGTVSRDEIFAVIDEVLRRAPRAHKPKTAPDKLLPPAHGRRKR